MKLKIKEAANRSKCQSCGSRAVAGINAKCSDMFDLEVVNMGRVYEGYVPEGMNLGAGIT